MRAWNTLVDGPRAELRGAGRRCCGERAQVPVVMHSFTLLRLRAAAAGVRLPHYFFWAADACGGASNLDGRDGSGPSKQNATQNAAQVARRPRAGCRKMGRSFGAVRPRATPMTRGHLRAAATEKRGRRPRPSRTSRAPPAQEAPRAGGVTGASRRRRRRRGRGSAADAARAGAGAPVDATS